MGGLYARHEGQPEAVSKAIYYHYLPVGVEPGQPPTREALGAGAVAWAAVSVADKLDSVVGLFAAGERPTGTRDPFALRRQAQGLLRVLVDLPELTGLDVSVVARRAGRGGRGQRVSGAGRRARPADEERPARRRSAPTAEWRGELTAFLVERLRFLFERRGFAYDEINAVVPLRSALAGDGAARRPAPPRGAAEDARLGRLRGAGRGVQARQEHREGRAPGRAPIGDATRRPTAASRRAALADEMRDRGPAGRAARRTRATIDRASALAAGFRASVDRFFTDVLVMHDDAAVRDRRLALVASLRDLILALADISEIARRTQQSRRRNRLTPQRPEHSSGHAGRSPVARTEPRRKLTLRHTHMAKKKTAKKKAPPRDATPRTPRQGRPRPHGRPRPARPRRRPRAKSAAKAGEVRLLLRRGQGRRQPDDEGHARRQGRQPRRDDQRRPAGAARVHDFDRRVPPLLRRAAQGARRRRDADGREPRASSRRPPGDKLGSRAEPAARLGPLGREVLDARHDGHHPEPRPQRRDRREACRRGPATAASPTTATAASSRCSATSCSRFRRTPSSTSSRRSSTSAARSSRHRPRRGGLQETSSRATRRWSGRRRGKPFPQDPPAQLRGARDAVFRSWNNPRAREYRRIYDIPDDIGTAVNVQAMVFGNTGDRSATGVGFTRNPATGANEFFGEFLVNAQGEDVVAGIRTPQPIAELEKVMPKAYKELRDDHHAASRRPTRTSRTSSSRSRTTSSTCCRPAAASAPATRRSSSPPTSSTEKLRQAAGGAAPGRARGALAAARAGVRSGRVEEAAGRDQGPAGLAGRGVRARRCSRPNDAVEWTNRRQEGAAGPQGDRARTTSTACSSRRAC